MNQQRKVPARTFLLLILILSFIRDMIRFRLVKHYSANVVSGEHYVKGIQGIELSML